MSTAAVLAGIPSPAELAELANIADAFRPGAVCVPVGAAYTANGAGGQTLTGPSSWREVRAGVRPISTGHKPDSIEAGGTDRRRRRWTVTTRADVDLRADNPLGIVVIATLAELTAQLADSQSPFPACIILSAPEVSDFHTGAVWHLEEAEQHIPGDDA